MRNIYALVDRRPGRIAYVAEVTTADYTAGEYLAFAHRTHEMNLPKPPADPARRQQWIDLMASAPDAILLERDAGPDAKSCWMHLLIESGHPLLNKRGVRRLAA